MSTIRIYPSINFARVGNSEEYLISPETAAGTVNSSGEFGGLPINPQTQQTIHADDFRDASGLVRRQAARYRLYHVENDNGTYPSKAVVSELKIGDIVDGKTVKDIIWSAHIANKKNNNFSITDAAGEEEGIANYKQGNTPPVRNPTMSENAEQSPIEQLAEQSRLQQLIIDPGPRAVSTANNESANFDLTEKANVEAIVNAQRKTLANYPVSYPSKTFTNRFDANDNITTLGQMHIEPKTGRLLMLGGYGKTFSFTKNNEGTPPVLAGPIDNDGWFDDVADGPVNALVIFEGDHKPIEAQGAWFVSTDPSYAPQTRNIVTTWDDIFNTWVEQLDLIPALYRDGSYNKDYKSSFVSDIHPIFNGAFLQQFNTNLPDMALKYHDRLSQIMASDDPTKKFSNFKSIVRNPNESAQDQDPKRMPLSLGDAGKSYLSMSATQYHMMSQWFEGNYTDVPVATNEAESLERDVLLNCLGGRYSPGIELTFIVRDTNLYITDTQARLSSGPFRIRAEALNYSNLAANKPVLGVGYVPLRSDPVQPGDLSKFMAQPWHTDYNSCAIHQPDPNKPAGNNMLYWSWPAQRPVQVYPRHACTYDKETKTWRLGEQSFSIRGDGTYTEYAQNLGRFQSYCDYVKNWEKTGFIIQGLKIDDEQGGHYGERIFLEVASQYEGESNRVVPGIPSQEYEAPIDEPKACTCESDSSCCTEVKS